MLTTTKCYFRKPSLFKRFKRLLSRFNLLKRIKNTRYYMKKCGYDLATAWRRAGITL